MMSSAERRIALRPRSFSSSKRLTPPTLLRQILPESGPCLAAPIRKEPHPPLGHKGSRGATAVVLTTQTLVADN